MILAFAMLFPEKVSISQKVIIQPISDRLGGDSKNEVLIRMPQTISNENVEGGIDVDKRLITEALYADYGDTGEFSIVNAETVGPQVGRDLRNRAIYVTLAALLGMLIYVAYRFEWIYGVAAVAAVFHDVLVTLTIFSLFNWEISLNVLASLLSLIGYSMNDTIVIFDRIREKLKSQPIGDINKISNEAINETLSRTLITSGLTFFSVLALLIFGGPVLRGFSLALFIGVIVGTYSSIFIATPIMLWGRRFKPQRHKGHKDQKE
jgi:preprotein translocase subunit SecF